MSDQDPSPQERLCAAGSSGSAVSGIEVLEPRAVPLGGLRAMTVRRTLPQRQRSLIGAWCFLDHYGPDEVAATGGMNVPAHPHTGLQTVSWLFTGEIEHRDSSGAHAMVRPGELNLMTAGSGISHSERSTPGTAVLHGAQLWIALPEAARHGERRFDHYAPPVRTGDGWTASVFLGSLLGDTSPVPTHTPLVGAELVLDPGAAVELAVDSAHEHGVLVDRGTVRLERVGADTAADPIGPQAAGSSLTANELGFSPVGAPKLRLLAGDSGARLLLIGGEPLAEQIVMWWNFVGRSHDEIARARADWQGTIEGTAPDAPFGLPDGEPELPLPAPVLPLTRLVPRVQPGAPAGSIVSKGIPMVQDHDAASPAAAEAPAEAPAEVRVVHQPDQRRYAVLVGDELAGFTEYVPRDGGSRLLFVHTETFPQFAGQGLASRLVADALAEVRASGQRIVPLCPYVAAWLRKHPGFEDAVDWPSE